MKYRLRAVDIANDMWCVEKKHGSWIFAFWLIYSDAGCGSKEKMRKIVDELNESKPV